ncbi:MAG TPA: cytochrome c [Acidobacteriota bacterium]
MSRRAAAAFGLIGLAGLTGCFDQQRRGLRFPWDENMQTHAAPRPQSQARPAPAAALAQGSERTLPREQSSALVAPAPSPAARAGGARLFAITCAPCHGSDGRGEGPVTPKFIPAPDLTDPDLQSKSDGYLYATIRDGGLVMPPHREALSPEERWQIVLYVRSLKR